MTDWDGTGLPPAALARVARAKASHLSGSMLSTGAFAGAESVGLDPVGEAMGCIVQQLGWAGGGCGLGMGFGGFIGPSRTVTSGEGQAWSGYQPYVNALYHGWDTAIARMLVECRDIGADGVIGVRLTRAELAVGAHEFVALGTAVRARGGRRPKAPFATELTGQDVAKLLLAGWVPSAIVIGISVGIRHDDYNVRWQSSTWGNTEVAGYTELVSDVRADARHQFARRAARAGADAAIISEMSLTVRELVIGEGHRDHIAESVVRGTSIARFHAGDSAPTTTRLALPLRPRTRSAR
jgi:uncharacterized protein YbjQ (UPF0145 family)